MSHMRITMMHWWQATTPSGRERSFAIKPFKPGYRIAITMVGEKLMSWSLVEWREARP